MIDAGDGTFQARIDLGQFIPHSDGFSLSLVAGKTKGTAKPGILI